MSQEALLWINAIFMASNTIFYFYLRRMAVIEENFKSQIVIFEQCLDRYQKHCLQAAVELDAVLTPSLRQLLSSEVLNELRVRPQSQPSGGGGPVSPSV